MYKAPKFPADTGAEDDIKDESPKKIELDPRILSIDIKTILAYQRDGDHLNSHTILEVFAKVYRFKDEGRKEKRLTLRGIDDAHTIEAIFFGNGPSIQIGDEIRCIGHVSRHSENLKIIKWSKINYNQESAMIRRLVALSGFELATILMN